MQSALPEVNPRLKFTVTGSLSVKAKIAQDRTRLQACKDVSVLLLV